MTSPSMRRIGVGLVIVTFAILVVGAYLAGVRCDDHCRAESAARSWADIDDSAQWTIQLLLGVSAFIASIVTAVEAGRGSVRRSAWGGVVTVVLTVTWFVVVAPAF